MALLQVSWILSLLIASLPLQLTAQEGTSGTLIVCTNVASDGYYMYHISPAGFLAPTPTTTATLLSQLQEYAVEFTIRSTALDEVHAQQMLVWRSQTTAKQTHGHVEDDMI